MANITFIDIPVVPKQWTTDVQKTVSLKYKAQDLIYANLGLRYPFQRKRKQFTRGLLTLSTHLKNKGHETSYFNYKSENLEQHIKNLPEGAYVGLPSITAFMNVIKDTSLKIKEWNPNIRLILGGYHATARTKQTFEEIPSIDFIITGEGELPLEDLLSGKQEAKGVFSKNEKQNLSKRTQLLDLDKISNPDYSLLSGNLNDYNFNIQTVRGCTYRCVFCVNGYFWKKERPTLINLVKEELLFLANNLEQNTFIHFSDNNFLQNASRAMEITNYIDNSLGSPFNISCDVRADSITPNLVKSMKNAGFKRIYIGIEETDEEILAATKKGVTASQAINSAKIIRENGEGIIIEAYWMNGLPGSTYESLERSRKAAEYLLDNNIIDLISGSTVFTPLPGTPIFDNPSKYKISIDNEDWDYYLRDNFYPPYHYTVLNVQQLHDGFLSFENMLLSKYKKKLNMTEEEIMASHEQLFGDIYSLKK